MDKNEIAALLEALCERPFAGGPDGRPPAVASRAGRALSHADADEEQSGSMAGGAEAGQAESPGRETAALASILSGTATDAQSQAFQAAAMTSGAVRLEAQSALAFVDGIEQTPLKAPAHLVEHVLASAAGAPSRSRPGIWSRLSGAPRGQVVAACVVMLMAGGLSWSLLLRPADLPAGHPAVPVATSPKEEPPIGDIAPKPAPAPAFAPSPAPPFAPAPAPEFVPAPAFAPVPAPAAPVLAPVPSSPPLQALADPCEPRSFAASEVGARSNVEAKAAKPAPNPQPRTAAVSALDPGCAVNAGTIEAGQNPQADQGPVRAAKPAAKVGRAERERPAAAASAPASAPSAGAAKRPTAIAPPR